MSTLPQPVRGRLLNALNPPASSAARGSRIRSAAPAGDSRPSDHRIPGRGADHWLSMPALPDVPGIAPQHVRKKAELPRLRAASPGSEAAAGRCAAKATWRRPSPEWTRTISQGVPAGPTTGTCNNPVSLMYEVCCVYLSYGALACWSLNGTVGPSEKRTSMITFACPQCGNALSHATPGAYVACPYCHHNFAAPIPATAAQPSLRCFRCGDFFPADEIVRREMETGRTRSAVGGECPTPGRRSAPAS